MITQHHKFEYVGQPGAEVNVAEVIDRLSRNPLAVEAARLIFPSLSAQQAMERLRAVTTVEDFQLEWMYHFNKLVIKNSMSDFTFSFTQPLDPAQGYLYISNHRDIMLDPSLLQMGLVDAGFPTTEITFGDNLLFNEFTCLVAQLNKMVVVRRGGSPRELLAHSQQLSRYIGNRVASGHSCWIAQRNGRTKDGRDRTEQGVVKMLAMAAKDDDMCAYFNSLNIVPVAISYEYESCDFLKAAELYAREQAQEAGIKYEKKPGEDLHSVLTGIKQWKGRVHFQVGTPIKLAPLPEAAARGGSEPSGRVPASLYAHAYIDRLMQDIDRQITRHYRLFPTHYLAYDLLYGASRFAANYTPQDKAAFMEHLNAFKVGDVPQAYPYLLGIYANPVLNYLNCATTAATACGSVQ